MPLWAREFRSYDIPKIEGVAVEPGHPEDAYIHRDVACYESAQFPENAAWRQKESFHHFPVK